MEAGVSARGLWLVLALAVLIRLPFLHQAIQGDDDIFLTEAAHAQVDPWHPLHTTYVFRGEVVDLRGQTHPPLDGWVLAALVALFGDVYEVPFHAAYIAFTLLAVWAMWDLARRYSPRPLWATLLFIAVPVFVVNGTSLETDLPLLAFWMAAVALFTRGRLVPAAAAMALAALASYQAVLIVPVLFAYWWMERRDHPRDLLYLLTPGIVIAAWQLFEWRTTGALPAAVLLGYLRAYQTPGNKLSNAVTLLVHALFLVWPLLLPGTAAAAWRNRRESGTRFLIAWIGIFFLGSVVIFFAGAARYLLPMAAPMALLASRLKPRWLAIGFAAQLALGLGLAAVNYAHWDSYRQFAQTLPQGRRTWVNGEWGLRYYVEHRGGLPLAHGTRLQPGEIVVSSELGQAIDITAPRVPLVKTLEVRPSIPLRLIGLESHSGYSTASRGFWPFGVSTGVIDRVRAEVVMARHPTLEYLPMDSPEAAEHIVSGVYPDHWTAGAAALVLKNPPEPEKLRVEFYLPPQAMADGRAPRVALLLDGLEVASATYSHDGRYTLETATPVRAAGNVADVGIQVNPPFFTPGDQRELGVVLIGVGFVK